jgi:hypothetical protein
VASYSRGAIGRRYAYGYPTARRGGAANRKAISGGVAMAKHDGVLKDAITVLIECI